MLANRLFNAFSTLKHESASPRSEKTITESPGLDSLPVGWQQLTSYANYVQYPKNSDHMYEARLCHAAEKYPEALEHLEAHFS